MDYQAITLDIADGVGVITLNRPDVMNALNTQMRAEITHAVKAAEAAARCVVLTGAGRAFCSGQDLGDGGSAATLDLERTLRDEYVPMLKAIFDCRVPTICAVNGAAAGAGANLALAADVVIASRRRVFCAGIHPHRIDPRCRRHLLVAASGRGRARDGGGAICRQDHCNTGRRLGHDLRGETRRRF